MRTIALSSSNKTPPRLWSARSCPHPSVQETRTTQRAVLVIQTCPCTAHRVGQAAPQTSGRSHAMQLILHAQQLCHVHPQACCGRNTCPALDNRAICSGRTASATIVVASAPSASTTALQFGITPYDNSPAGPDCLRVWRCPTRRAHGQAVLSDHGHRPVCHVRPATALSFQHCVLADQPSLSNVFKRSLEAASSSRCSASPRSAFA